MFYKTLSPADCGLVEDLYSRCFLHDSYFVHQYGEGYSAEDLVVSFRTSFEYCLNEGRSIGLFDGYRMITFALLFDYGAALSAGWPFYEIFPSGADGRLLYEAELHRKIQSLPGQTIFLLAIATDPERQRSGLASAVMDEITVLYQDCNLAGDVSNAGTLGLYRKRGFCVEPIDEDYYLVIRRRSLPAFRSEETRRKGFYWIGPAPFLG